MTPRSLEEGAFPGRLRVPAGPAMYGMNNAMVMMVVGGSLQIMKIHKDLLLEFVPVLHDRLTTPSTVSAIKGLEPIEQLALPNDDATVVGFFIMCVNSALASPILIVPGGPPSTSRAQKVARVRLLVQVYAFCEKYDAKFLLLNRIMDSIQDGFRELDMEPTAELTTAIYKHTRKTSKLRQFAASALVFHLRNKLPENHLHHFSAFLSGNLEILVDVLSATKTYVPEKDPRVRQCEGEIECIECARDPDRLRDIQGYWPCAFHHHVGFLYNNHLYAEPPMDIPSEKHQHANDVGCYLWRSGYALRSDDSDTSL